MSLRRTVAKHLGAKVFLFFFVFCLSLSFPVSSAVVTIVAHAKCLIFSCCVQPKQTTVAAARDIKHILSCAPKHFSLGGSPWLHKALMIWLYVESHELPTESNKTDIYSYVGRALGSELNKVKLHEDSRSHMQKRIQKHTIPQDVCFPSLQCVVGALGCHECRAVSTVHYTAVVF